VTSGSLFAWKHFSPAWRDFGAAAILNESSLAEPAAVKAANHAPGIRFLAQSFAPDLLSFSAGLSEASLRGE
jgi:hypothetical protein